MNIPYTSQYDSEAPRRTPMAYRAPLEMATTCQAREQGKTNNGKESRSPGKADGGLAGMGRLAGEKEEG